VVAYLIVQYWEFLALSAGLGILVGWWAQGSRRTRVAEIEDGPS
jgi:hypothetical protein